MGKYTGYMIVTDFDGSFAEHGEVSSENAQAVRAFQAEGGLFTIASGRNPAFILSKKDSFVPNAPVVSMNGTYISDPLDIGRAVAEFPLDDDALDVICAIADRAPVRSVVLFDAKKLNNTWQADCGTPIREFFQNAPKPYYKGMFVINEEDMPILLRAAEELCSGNYELNCSWSEGLELHAKGTGKGECLYVLREWARETLGLDKLTIIGVGDYGNDLSLIKMADIGIAVENAVDSLKEAADRVTVKNTDHAIAKIISGLS